MAPHAAAMARILRPAAFFLAIHAVSAGGPENVLIVVNESSALSRQIGAYYAQKRSIPAAQICRVRTAADEIISRQVYDTGIAAAVAACLRKNGLAERILYIVTTAGVPLRIRGTKSGRENDGAAVDSELTLLYSTMKGQQHRLDWAVENPFFGKRDAPFQHPSYPIYLVTRLAAYDFNDVRALIDRSHAAVNRGKFVLDLDSDEDRTGNNWLRNTAFLLPPSRTVIDESKKVIYGEKDVIGFASWGSNDKNRDRRFVGFRWLPGAIMTEYVSTNGRTFERPPENWTIGAWSKPRTFFHGSPQSMTADYIREGVTGASGHVDEPYLSMTPRPDQLFPAYYQGRNLAESYYLGIPGLSWQNIVIGDPLCSLGKPKYK